MTNFETKYRDLVAGLEALAEEFSSRSAQCDQHGAEDEGLGDTISAHEWAESARVYRHCSRDLRALLASSPAEREGEGPTIPEAVWHEWHGDAPAPVSSGEAGEHEWWDVDHDRKADVYCPPEQVRCRRCGQGYNMHTFMGGTCRPAPVVTPSTETEEGAR